MLIGIFLFLFILYWVICYFLVSLALVPSFMEKTEVFETVTDVSVEALVQTSDIKNNRSSSLNETKEWLKAAERETLSIYTTDGYKLIGVIFSPEEETSLSTGNSSSTDDPSSEKNITSENCHKWVLLLHGYTGWKEELYPIAYQYVQQGYHVLVPDMRCSGESEGDFIGMGWTDRLDNMLWLDEILSRDPDARIVIQGQSMGAACALMMSGEELPSQVFAIVSDCAYTDAYSMFAKQMKDWFGLPSFPLLDSTNLVLQLRGGYDLKDASALEAVKKTDLPVLIIHGEEDDMVPVEMAYELYDAAGREKELLIIPGAGHAQAMDKDPELYYDTIFSFLNEAYNK
ncbi:MAG: alpha/beta hydrolase [Roseburia sp.]|nr:alpha/beta hydrolase [Roseburia sp.]